MFFLDSGDDSDAEINEWENQQIRKGVTGAQVTYSSNGTLSFLIFDKIFKIQFSFSQSARNGPARVGHLFAIFNQIGSR